MLSQVRVDELQSGFQEWAQVVSSRKARRAWGIIAAVTAITGPFGSYADMSLPIRLIYWPLVVAGAIGLGSAVRVIARRKFGARDPWRMALAVALMNMAVFTPLLVLLSPLATDNEIPSPLEFAAFVLTGSIGLSAVRWTLGIDRPAEDPMATPVPLAIAIPANDPSPPRLLARLSDVDRSARLIRISGDNHHVEVATDQGTARILLRFADAVAEAAPVEGLQVHRSHWVALASVSGAERKAGKTVLRLVDGSEVPVSRNYQDAVTSAGLI